jgi:hypothetical protein
MQEKAFQCTFQCTLEYQIQVGKSNKSTLLKFQVYHGCKIDYYHIGCLQQQQRRRHQQRAYQMESAWMSGGAEMVVSTSPLSSWRRSSLFRSSLAILPSNFFNCFLFLLDNFAWFPCCGCCCSLAFLVAADVEQDLDLEAAAAAAPSAALTSEAAESPKIRHAVPSGSQSEAGGGSSEQKRVGQN